MVNAANLGRKALSVLFSIRAYLGASGAKRRQPIETPEALSIFVETRSSHVAQTSLYGYMRTRAGTRHAELFHNNDFVVLLNVAKWHVFAACISDLTVFAGGLMARAGGDEQTVRDLMKAMLEAIFNRIGMPEEAGPQFVQSCQKVRERIASQVWREVLDGEDAFSVSPDALVEWSPIVDTLKDLDAGIVRNSIRFRWQEIRRDFRADVRPAEILAAAKKMDTQPAA